MSALLLFCALQPSQAVSSLKINLFLFILIGPLMRGLGKLSMKINIFGHRGFGASDSAFHAARDQSMNIQRIAENTLESHQLALAQGAEGVEMDAIATADGYIVSTHADEVGQHVKVPYHVPQKYVGRMTFEELQHIPVGPIGTSRIPLLRDILRMMKSDFPDRIINIELKGKLDNLDDDSYTHPTLSEKIMQVIEECNFPLENVVFSSFAMSYLDELDEVCSNKKVQFKKGILFDLAPPTDHTDTSHKPILLNRDDYYIPLSLSSLKKAHSRFSTMYSIHAEIRSLTPPIMSYLHTHNLVLHAWGLRELSPLDSSVEAQEFASAVRNVVAMAREVGMGEINIITDHVLEMKEFVRTLN
ncbi:hypothetical protein EON65_38235 [archaeon]|nr:MAG: hypothetical protein EON65_38235 [archaeon]